LVLSAELNKSDTISEYAIDMRLAATRLGVEYAEQRSPQQDESA